MKNSEKKLEIKLQRTVPASPKKVFAGWLDPKIPGNPWNAAESLIMNPKVGGLFFCRLKGTSHYGRFTEIKKPKRIRILGLAHTTHEEVQAE